MRNVIKLTIILIIAMVINGCGSKEPEYKTVESTISDSKNMWMFKPETGINEGETCVVSTKINYNDPSDITILLGMANSNLIAKMSNKITNSKEISVSKGSSTTRSHTEFGAYSAQTAKDIQIGSIESYIKNIDTYNDKIVIRVCSKGFNTLTNIVDTSLQDFAEDDR